MEGKQKRESFRKKAGLLAHHLRPAASAFALGIGASLAATLLRTLFTQIIRFTVDHALLGETDGLPAFLLDAPAGRILVWCAAAAATVALLEFGAGFVQDSNLPKGSERFVKSLRDALYGHIQRLPYSWHVQNPTGDIIQRCTSDVEVVRNFIAEQMVELLSTTFLIAVYMIAMFAMNVKISLFVFAFIPVIVGYSLVFYKRISKGYQKADEAEGELSSTVQENITGVRVVQYLVLAALFAAVAVLLRRRCGLRAAVWFAVSQLLVTAFWAPHQVQFFTCFAVAYAGCVWVLAKPRRSDDVCLALLVLGVVTSFCDLLVTPVLTLGLPLVCWLLAPQQRLRAGTRQCGIVVGGSLTWGVGYLLCWASKWVLAGLVTGQNVIADALHQVGVRTAADSWHGMELTWSNILHFVYTALAGKHLFWPLVLAVVLLLALFAASIRDRQQLARALPLGLCALMTPAWFIVLRTHSIQHGWFTWRALGLTVFAGPAFLYYCCDVRQIAKRLKRT